MKYENEFSDCMTVRDLKKHNWSSHIKKINGSEFYALTLEDKNGLEAPIQVLDEKDAENLATFCRGYLLALEYVKTQEEKNV